MGRAPCCDKNGLKKGPWTPEEDQKLVDYIKKHGYGNWRILPKNAGLQRCGKSCRLRWTNYLRPDIKRGRFSFKEEDTIIQLHSILGNKWSAIAARLPGRTDNEIKNYWNTHIRKKLLRMGIDPVTHSPRLDLLDLSSILSSQMTNMSRFYGHHHHHHHHHQGLVNPELLKLATSLYHLQNPQTVQQNAMVEQLMFQQQQLDLPPRPTLDNLSQWQSCNNPNLPNSTNEDDYVPVLPSYNNNDDYNNYGQDQSVCFATTTTTSVLSTPSSCLTTALNSNSTTTYLEDELESYCSDYMLKFELPDILDVNYDQFIM